MATPLEVREFFSGLWTGRGELLPAWWARWFYPKERVDFSSEAVWLSPTVWLVNDRFRFSSGRVLETRMFCELTARDRIHVTADHMPLGADILLSERGFAFTPYRVVVEHRGIRLQLRCLDENTLDPEGRVHDRIRMFWHGIPAGELRLGPIERGENAGSR